MRTKLLLCVAGLTAAFAALGAAQTNTALAGRWEGTVPIPDAPTTLILDLGRTQQGDWIGSFIAPGFGAKGAPLKEVAFTGGTLSAAIPGLSADAKIALHLSGEALEGQFECAGHKAPLALRRTGPAQVEVPPQSTAVATPFEGVWTALIELNSLKFHAELTLKNEPGGKATGQMKVAEFGNTPLPLTLITQEGDWLMFRAEAAGIDYQGRINKTATALEGSLFVFNHDAHVRWERPAKGNEATR